MEVTCKTLVPFCCFGVMKFEKLAIRQVKDPESGVFDNGVFDSVVFIML